VLRHWGGGGDVKLESDILYLVAFPLCSSLQNSPTLHFVLSPLISSSLATIYQCPTSSAAALADSSPQQRGSAADGYASPVLTTRLPCARMAKKNASPGAARPDCADDCRVSFEPGLESSPSIHLPSVPVGPWRLHRPRTDRRRREPPASATTSRSSRRVTLGGPAKSGADRHPKVRDGVLLLPAPRCSGNIEIWQERQLARQRRPRQRAACATVACFRPRSSLCRETTLASR